MMLRNGKEEIILALVKFVNLKNRVKFPGGDKPQHSYFIASNLYFASSVCFVKKSSTLTIILYND